VSGMRIDLLSAEALEDPDLGVDPAAEPVRRAGRLQFRGPRALPVVLRPPHGS
jgi:hypothetical protein